MTDDETLKEFESTFDLAAAFYRMRIVERRYSMRNHDRLEIWITFEDITNTDAKEEMMVEIDRDSPFKRRPDTPAFECARQARERIDNRKEAR